MFATWVLKINAWTGGFLVQGGILVAFPGLDSTCFFALLSLDFVFLSYTETKNCKKQHEILSSGSWRVVILEKGEDVLSQNQCCCLGCDKNRDVPHLGFEDLDIRRAWFPVKVVISELMGVYYLQLQVLHLIKHKCFNIMGMCMHI